MSVISFRSPHQVRQHALYINIGVQVINERNMGTASSKKLEFVPSVMTFLLARPICHRDKLHLNVVLFWY